MASYNRPLPIPGVPVDATSEDTSTPVITTASSSKPSGESIFCNGCKQGLEDTGDSVVVSFGNSLWHVDCFRCAKCHNLVEHDTNLLLLSDGSPVCENCSYICSVCQKLISNEAIVTGDESYHSECFRCRSCSQRIEELIFAKTSQGIWCMNCHNERVARSRKHAEMKRSKSKRDKDGRSPRPRGERDRERERDRTAPINPPLNPLKESTTSIDALASGLYDRTATSPSRKTTRDREEPPKYNLSSLTPPYSSKSSLESPAHSRQTSNNPRSLPSQDFRQGSMSSKGLDSALKNIGPVSSISPSSTISNNYNVQRSLYGDSFPMDLSQLRSALPISPVTNLNNRSLSPTSNNTLLQPTSQPTNLTVSTSLATPQADTNSRRRSGMFNPLDIKRPSIEEPIHENVTSTPLISSPVPLDQHFKPSSQIAPSLPELPTSASFYDADTLLFLNTVGGSQPASPKATAQPFGSTSELLTPTEPIEHLIDPPPAAAEVEDQKRAKAELTSRVRESIRISRESLSDSMKLDVEMVETLLTDLDSTKRTMQDLQQRYNAFRRASRSAFEGFSMAREEYDKEVAARRELEHQMEDLQMKFTEQALRLASFDNQEKTKADLENQSSELRHSVVDLEKQVLQLKAEVEVNEALVAGLEDQKEIQKDGEEKTDSTHDRSEEELGRLLDEKLEAIKARHLQEVQALIDQKEALEQEIFELKQSRDLFMDETQALNNQNSTLAEQISEASRHLESLRASSSALSLPSMKSNTGSGSATNHSHSASIASTHLLSKTTTSSTNKNYYHNAPDQDDTHKIIQPEIVQVQTQPVVKKFKWGKAKVEPRMGHATAPSTARIPLWGGGGGHQDRHHVFQPTSILRPIRCEYCGDKMWGLNEVRCSLCGIYCHTKCTSFLQSTCGNVPALADDTINMTPAHSMFGSDLTNQARLEDRPIPLIVTKSIEAVEMNGMEYEGIYRKTGGMGQTKLIAQCFDRGDNFDLDDQDKFNDLAAVTSCLKNFFRELSDPLFTHSLHEAFVSCAEIQDNETRLQTLEKLIYQLPEVHFHTAKALIAHLHRVHLFSQENLMTPQNLGVVFGPTLLRSSMPNRELSDMGMKAKLIELMVENSPRLFSKPYNGPASD